MKDENPNSILKNNSNNISPIYHQIIVEEFKNCDVNSSEIKDESVEKDKIEKHLFKGTLQNNIASNNSNCLPIHSLIYKSYNHSLKSSDGIKSDISMNNILPKNTIRDQLSDKSSGNKNLIYSFEDKEKVI